MMEITHPGRPPGRRTAALRALAVLGLALGGAGQARAEQIIGLTVDNTLVRFDSATPGSASSQIGLTGVGDDNIIGIDYRPATNTLYGVGVGGLGTRLYRIDAATGVASLASTLTPDTTLGSVFGGVDFNPVPDRLRVTTVTDQNLRINVATGGVTTDGPLAFAAGDVNAGADPRVVGSAYSNNNPGVTTTTLFNIDSSLDILVTQAPPNDGTLNTIGLLNAGFDVGDLVGFDISGATGVAYASLTPLGGGATSLFSIDTGTGQATSLGQIGSGLTLRDISVVRAVPEPASLALIGSGGAGLLALARRRRAGTAPRS